MVEHTFNSSTWEGEACRYLLLWGHSVLHNRFQASQGHIIRPCLQKYFQYEDTCTWNMAVTSLAKLSKSTFLPKLFWLCIYSLRIRYCSQASLTIKYLVYELTRHASRRHQEPKWYLSSHWWCRALNLTVIVSLPYISQQNPRNFPISYAYHFSHHPLPDHLHCW